jgi:ornithine cyclodeaminase/alanine dehydrogenase-like protein (mu-crystallin family)
LRTDVKPSPSLVVLSEQDPTALMPFGEYVDAVAEAFRLHTEGRAVSPPPMHVPAVDGGADFHA